MQKHKTAEETIVLAYSGGLDTSVAVAWLRETYGFEVAGGALAPEMTVIAPLRSGMNMTREDEIDYAKARGIPVPVTKKSPYSVDENLWGRSIEAGVLEDPWGAPPRDVFQWTVDPDEAPAKPYEIIIGFSEGIPVTLNGIKVASVDLVQRLNELAGKHGVGRIDMVEDRLVGIKSREIYAAPAAGLLHQAHRPLKALVLTK